MALPLQRAYPPLPAPSLLRVDCDVLDASPLAVLGPDARWRAASHIDRMELVRNSGNSSVAVDDSVAERLASSIGLLPRAPGLEPPGASSLRAGLPLIATVSLVPGQDDLLVSEAGSGAVALFPIEVSTSICRGGLLAQVPTVPAIAARCRAVPGPSALRSIGTGSTQT